MNVSKTYFTYNFNYSILFLLIRPQQKRAKEHREMISRIESGQRITTIGGLKGTVKALMKLQLLSQLMVMEQK